MHDQRAEGLEELGFRFVVKEKSERLPQLNTVELSVGLNEQGIRAKQLNEYNLEIGAGLGPFAGKV